MLIFRLKNIDYLPTMAINPKDISVIIRGLIVGSNDTDKNKQFTKRSLASVRKYLPGAQIIVSTWKGQETSGLDCDVLIESEEPGVIDMISRTNTLFKVSTNNQIVSTQKGLEKADRKYCIIMRTDIVLSGAGFMKYFEKFNRAPSCGFVEKKVVVLPTFNGRKRRDVLFGPADWFFFGLTKDIKNIFDIPLMDTAKLAGPKINDHYVIGNNFNCESYIWTNFLKKYQDFYFPNRNYFSEEALALSEKSYAQNLIMLPAKKATIGCLKFPHIEYAAEPWSSQDLYTFNEYKKMYNKYNMDKIFIIPNILDGLGSRLIIWGRKVIQKILPITYKKIVNSIRTKRKNSFNITK